MKFFSGGFLPFFVAMVALPHSLASVQVSTEEERLLAEIAQCMITKVWSPLQIQQRLEASECAFTYDDVQRDHLSPGIVQPMQKDIKSRALGTFLFLQQPDTNRISFLDRLRQNSFTRNVLGLPGTTSYSEQEQTAARMLRKAEEDFLAAKQEALKRAEAAAWEQKKAALRKKLLEDLAQKPSLTPLETTQRAILTKEQEQYLRNMKMQSLKKQLTIGTGITAGMSMVINYKLLLAGELLEYGTNVGKDVGIGMASQGLGFTLEEIGFEKLAPGAGVIVFGVVDLIKASRTGDWSRFGINTALNTGSTIGGLAGAKAGALVGSVGGPWGIAAGGIIGGFCGAMGFRWGLGKTPLGGMTFHEKQKALEKIAQDMNQQWEAIGLKLDISQGYDKVMERISKGDFPVTATSDFANAQVTLQQTFSALGGQDKASTILDYASTLRQARVEGLKVIRNAVCGG